MSPLIIKIPAYFFAIIYGLANSAAYDQSLKHSADRFGFPPFVTLLLGAVFSFGLTTSMGLGKYAEDNEKVLGRCVKPVEQAEPLIEPSSEPGNNNNFSHAWGGVLSLSELIGAMGKALISNASLFRLFEREAARLTTAGNFPLWLSIAGVALTFPSTVFVQYAVLKKETNPDSFMARILTHLSAIISLGNMARLANTPGTVMYFDTARKMMEEVGWLSADYQPISLIAALAIPSVALLVAGNEKFQRDMARITHQPECTTGERQWMKTPYLGKITQVLSAFLKSFAGVLALWLMLDSTEIAKWASYLMLSIAVPALSVTMYSYFSARSQSQQAPSAERGTPMAAPV